jgi:hypothetical protein
MKTLSLLALPAVLTFAAASPATSYSTNWSFVSSTGGYKVSYAWDLHYNIVMPSGSHWACSKDPVSINKRGELAGGFICVSGTLATSVFVSCSPAKAESDSAGACVYDDGVATCFSVSCMTRSASASGI